MGTRQDLNHPFPFIPCSLWIFLWEYVWESFCIFQLVYWANCSTCWSIILFFFIWIYLIYHVVFQVYSKVIQLYIYMYLCFPLGWVFKESPCNEGDLCSIPGMGRYAQRDMASLSSILAWGISWTVEPRRLQSIGSQRVGHFWINWACRKTYKYLFLYKFFLHLVVTEFLAEFPVVL